ncbi:MAG: hypothetical protein AAB646_00750 [Patescibacteria group bacterium]
MNESHARFDLNKLLFRDNNGLPIFIPLDIETYDFEIGMKTKYIPGSAVYRVHQLTFKLPDSMPFGVVAAYKDIYKIIEKVFKSRGNQDVILRAEAAIKVPYYIRHEINEALLDFKYIFIASKVSGLNFDKATIIQNSKYELVGSDGFQYWILNTFRSE